MRAKRSLGPLYAPVRIAAHAQATRRREPDAKRAQCGTYLLTLGTRTVDSGRSGATKTALTHIHCAAEDAQGRERTRLKRLIHDSRQVSTEILNGRYICKHPHQMTGH